MGPWASTLAPALLVQAAHARADDSCVYARDGECDDPGLCQGGTDSTDCTSAQATSSIGLGGGESFSEVGGGDPLLGGALIAAAAYVWVKRLAAPRSAWVAMGLLGTGLAVLSLGMLPWVIAEPLFELTSELGLAPQTFLLLLGLAIVLYGLARAQSAVAGAGAGAAEVEARAALSPDMHEAESEEISAARRMCADIASRLETALHGAGGRFHLYAQFDAASQPWVQVDRLASDPRGAFIASLRIDFVPQPFKQHPVLMNLAVDDRGRRRRVRSIVELGELQVRALVTCLMGQGPRFVWKGERLREWGWQLWRPKQVSAVLESPFMAGLRANFKLAGVLLAVVVLFSVWQAQPVVVTALVLTGIWAWFRWYVPAPAYRVTSACPPRPPRRLRQLDSWQVVVRDLGLMRESVIDRLESSLAERMSGAEEPVTIRRENIWYEGVTGKVERQQLTASLRRAIVFVRIYQYGPDLFVGWDAHVNLNSWKDKAIEKGHRASDGLRVHLVGVATEYRPVNEYDLTDANFLLEAVHAHLTSLLKDVLHEREIDQEIDFAIVRESRQTLLGDPEKGRRRLFKRE